MLTKIFALSIFLSSCLLADAQLTKYMFTQPIMGSPFNLIIYATDSLKARNAAAMAFSYIDTLNNVYSDYLPNSELNRLCATAGTGKWVSVSAPLFTILQKALQASKISDGTFDVTISPVVRLWRQARKEKQLPDSESIKIALQRCGYRKVKLNKTNQSVLLEVKGMQLDLGGIAKGETAQRVIDTLSKTGCNYALLDAGGDIVAGEVPPGIKAWRVAVNLPETEELMQSQLLLQNEAVTTSGDLYQYLEVDGKRYSHIIDPRNGWALTNTRNVTVISKDGTNADWLTKACSVLPIAEALKLIRRFPQTEVQIATLQNDEAVFYRSPGFTKYFQER